MAKGKITVIQVRGFKRIEAFTAKLDPNQGVIRIAGGNANGKSSALDAIEYVLRRPSVKEPVRTGAGRAEVALTIAETPDGVTWKDRWRAFRVTDASGTKLTIQDLENGNRPVPDQATLLKQWLSEITIGPLEFINAEPRDQRRVLLETAGADVSKIDAELKAKRTALGDAERDQARAEGMVKNLTEHADAPAEEVSAVKITERLQAAIAANAANQRVRDSIAVLEQRSDEAAEAAIAAAKRAEEALAASEAAEKAYEEAKGELVKLTDVDITPIQEELENIDQVNRKVRDNARYKDARAEWKATEDAVKALVAEINALNASKKDMLSKLAFPVEGLGFDDNGVTLNGKPFEQGSDAEKIRAAIGIGLSNQKYLAPVLIRNASLLDNKMLASVAEIAEEFGAQVFLELVANFEDGEFDREAEFYILDGENVNEKGEKAL